MVSLVHGTPTHVDPPTLGPSWSLRASLMEEPLHKVGRSKRPLLDPLRTPVDDLNVGRAVHILELGLLRVDAGPGSRDRGEVRRA